MSALETLLVFTHPLCPHSRALVDDFRRRGVVFREIPVEGDGPAMDRLRSRCWEHRLPVVIDHERVSVGYAGGSSSFDELGLD